MKAALIFAWPGRHQLHLLLPLTILAAAILHAGLFFVFSIIYPRPENSGPDPAQIFFIMPGSADASRLEGVIRSSDPAVFAPGRGLDLPEPVPPVTYTPQYASDKPLLDPLPPDAKSDAPLPAFSGPVPVRRDRAKASGLPPARVPTKLTSADSLAGRLPALPENSVFSIPQGFDPEPAVFLVSVRGDGRVSHLFQQHSSGNAALDLRAAGVLRGLKFAPGPEPDSWGFVTFQWGTDLQPVAPQ